MYLSAHTKISWVDLQEKAVFFFFHQIIKYPENFLISFGESDMGSRVLYSGSHT